MRNPGQGSKTRSAYMAVRVSHQNEMIARKIDAKSANPLATRALSVAALAAIFRGAGTRELVAIEWLDDSGEVEARAEVGTELALTDKVNGYDFKRGFARPVFR